MPTPWHIFAGRFQPFHNGHFWVVRRIVELHKAVIIGVVNPEPESPRDTKYPSFHPYHNPFTFWERTQMIKAACVSAKIFDRVRLVPLEHPRTGLTTEAAYLPKERVWVLPPLDEHERSKIVDFRRLGEEVLEIDVPEEYKYLSSTLLRACLYHGTKNPLQCGQGSPVPCLPSGAEKVLSNSSPQYRLEALVRSYPEFGAYYGYDCPRLVDVTTAASNLAVIEGAARQGRALIDECRLVLDRLISDPKERAAQKQQTIAPLEQALEDAVVQKDLKGLEEVVRNINGSLAQARRALAKQGD